MTDTLQNRVVNLIPSRDLRNAIKEKEFVLSDIALLATVYHCAPDFASRIEHLQVLESAFSGEIKSYVSNIIETQNQMLKAFLSDESGVVYELHIKETPDAYDETYMCCSLDAAIKMISLFYQEYDSKENESSRYRIVKRRVFSAKEGEAFSEDYLGDLALLPNRVIYSVNMNGFCAEDCDGFCLECDSYCVHRQDVLYPNFTDHADAVKYRKGDGSTCFGVILQLDDAPTNECYIIPLECERIRYHDFKNAHYSHEHIPAVLVEKVSADCIPDSMRENYLAYAAYLRDNSAWG